MKTSNAFQDQIPQLFGAHILRYGLALVILWIGLMKFTAYEASGIQPLVASSPLMGWMYSFLSVRDFSHGLGIVEVTVALLIAFRPWLPLASAAGSAGAIVMFLTTISFLFSAPGWEPTLGGFPALSASVGQFIIKDVVLLGAAVWTCGEAYVASKRVNQDENV
ncbi:MAG: YkgB family protein [Bryobacteraceae bacterium]|nr:YkgB family protein [Bryobacteraceae bacterium]